MRFTTLTPIPRPAFRESSHRTATSQSDRRVDALEASSSDHEQGQEEKDSAEFSDDTPEHKHIDTVA